MGHRVAAPADGRGGATRPAGRPWRVLTTKAKAIHLDTLKSEVFGNEKMSDKRACNIISSLSTAPTDIHFPWGIGTKGSYLVIDRGQA